MRSSPRTLWTAALRIVPGCATLDEDGRGRFDALVTRALGARRPAMRRQFGLFLAVVRWAPAFRWGRPFDSLDDARRDRFLSWLENNPLRPLRQGFWGLKTIVCMGYYGQPELSRRFSYAPDQSGNDALDAR
jgi:hypothetical protein